MTTVHEYCEAIRRTLAEIEHIWAGEPDQQLRRELNSLYLYTDAILTAVEVNKAIVSEVDELLKNKLPVAKPNGNRATSPPAA